MSESGHRVGAANRPTQQRRRRAEHVHIRIENRHHPQRDMALNRQRQRIGAAACKNPVPQSPHGTAAGDAGKHVRRKGKPRRKPPRHGSGIDTLRVGRAQHRHKAGGDKAEFLRRRQAAIVPVPSIDTEQPVRRRRLGVKRQPGRHVAQRIKAEVKRDIRRVGAGHRQQAAVMGHGGRRAVEADRHGGQCDALKL